MKFVALNIIFNLLSVTPQSKLQNYRYVQILHKYSLKYFYSLNSRELQNKSKSFEVEIVISQIKPKYSNFTRKLN